jgi:hypothetical protein
MSAKGWKALVYSAVVCLVVWLLLGTWIVMVVAG